MKSVSQVFKTPRRAQRGGFALGLIVGLLLGLAVALGVALYVTKTPVPLMNKGQQRTPEQDAAETERNKNWDPNAGLIGKATTRPAPAPAVPASDAAVAPHPAPTTPAAPTPAGPVLPTAADNGKIAPAAAVHSNRDAAAILNGQMPADPAAAEASGADAFIYFVQVGAYSRPEDAEQQRAKLALAGFRATVSEREQNGKTVHRVRLGPFDRKEDADAQEDRAKAIDPEASLVRVERTKQ